MDSEIRSREARSRAEDALVRFALLAGEHARDYVVIGGLNPDFLATSAPVPHQGTTDIDLLFALGFDNVADSPDFSWVDAALDAGGFTSINGWRWDALDKYDLMYVTLYNDSGAREAARAVARQLAATEDSSEPAEIRGVMKRYLDPNGSWAGVFAETMIGTGDSAPENQLRVDAAEGARSFLDELERA